MPKKGNVEILEHGKGNVTIIHTLPMNRDFKLYMSEEDLVSLKSLIEEVLRMPKECECGCHGHGDMRHKSEAKKCAENQYINIGENMEGKPYVVHRCKKASFEDKPVQKPICFRHGGTGHCLYFFCGCSCDLCGHGREENPSILEELQKEVEKLRARNKEAAPEDHEEEIDERAYDFACREILSIIRSKKEV